MSDFLPTFGGTPAQANPAQDNLAIPAEWFDEKPKFDKIPPGEYVVKVSGREIFQKEGNDKISYKWTLTIVEGQYAGKNITYFTTVGIKGADGKIHDTPDKWRYTATLAALNVTPQTLPEANTPNGFAPSTQALLNRMCRVQVTHNGDYVNVRKVMPAATPGQLFEGSIPAANSTGLLF